MQGKHGSLETTTIQEQLRERNLHNWGFVIYRCSYGTDQEWLRFMKIFKRQAEYAIVNAGGAPKLYQKLSWTVVEDRSLEGATTAQVRATFRNWIFSPQAESEIPATLRQPRSIIPPGHSPEEEKLVSRTSIAPRYRYCIQVDDIALNSILKYGEDEVGGMLSTLYSYLVEDGYWDEWYYHRPPRVWQDSSRFSNAPEDVPPPKE